MQVVRVNSEPFLDFSDEGITGALLGSDAHASYTLGIVPKGGRQRLHYQSRPDNGTEIIFVYEGRFNVLGVTDDLAGPFDCDVDGPVLVVCPSGQPCSLESNGSEVRFFSVFAPPFQMGEITYIE